MDNKYSNNKINQIQQSVQYKIDLCINFNLISHIIFKVMDYDSG